MSNLKTVEVVSSDPQLNASIKLVADLVSSGIPFVAVPCFTPRQVEVAFDLGAENCRANACASNKQTH